MSRAILRRAIQLAAFAFAALAGAVLDLAPPGISQLLAAIAAMVALTVLGLAAVAGKRSSRARRTWLFAAVGLAVAGATCGLWYQSRYSASVFVYEGDGRAHVAGAERTAAAERMVKSDASYLDPNKLLFDAAGNEAAVWTAESISRVRTRLAELYLAFVLSLAASAFAAAELVPDAERAPPPTQQPRAEPLTILFLAANPTGTVQLRLDQECAAIEKELLLANASEHFRFLSKWAVTIDDVMRHLNDHRPAILHFSGHGQGSSGEVAIVDARDFVGSDEAGEPIGGGVALEDRPFVPAAALAKMIHAASPSTRVVVLNACYTADLGSAITAKHVDCVVGMRGAIADNAARAFAVGFYRAIGHRRSVANAVAQAVASLAAFQLPDANLPTCVPRAGVDADKLVL